MASIATAQTSRQQPLSRLNEARQRTDALFGLVRPEALYDRPIPERHRIVFYIGHLEAFDWNLIARHVLNLPAAHPQFDKLFAFGIDPVDGGLPTDLPKDWPRLNEVYDYVARLRRSLDDVIASASFDDPALPLLCDGYILHVAIEHRFMHAETLAYMLHQLPLSRKVLEPLAAPPTPRAVAPRMIDIPAGPDHSFTVGAGVATLGMQRETGEFGWDNEFPAHSVEVPAFAIDAAKVTNGAYLVFMKAGGYDDPSLWNPADWDWIRSREAKHPVFWAHRHGNWMWRAMFGELPLPLDWPVYVSHAEASAYARWAGKKLPTEAQWHRAAYGTPQGTERSHPWGSAPPSPQHGNFDFQRWDPVSVAAHPAGASAWGVLDLAGNGWEWTRTVFEPFPGFQPFPFYPGYSANFFDGEHYVMKGGSPRTAACMLRRSFRNWFQAHYGYVYAGFRCVQD